MSAGVGQSPGSHPPRGRSRGREESGRGAQSADSVTLRSCVSSSGAEQGSSIQWSRLGWARVESTLGTMVLRGLLAALALLALQSEQVPSAFATQGPALWPMPLSVQMTPRLLYLSPESFHIAHHPSSKAGPSCALLQEAFRR